MVARVPALAPAHETAPGTHPSPAARDAAGVGEVPAASPVMVGVAPAQASTQVMVPGPHLSPAAQVVAGVEEAATPPVTVGRAPDRAQVPEIVPAPHPSLAMRISTWAEGLPADPPFTRQEGTRQGGKGTRGRQSPRHESRSSPGSPTKPASTPGPRLIASLISCLALIMGPALLQLLTRLLVPQPALAPGRGEFEQEVPFFNSLPCYYVDWYGSPIDRAHCYPVLGRPGDNGANGPRSEQQQAHRAFNDSAPPDLRSLSATPTWYAIPNPQSLVDQPEIGEADDNPPDFIVFV